LDDGGKLPEYKQFEGVKYFKESRNFSGVISWENEPIMGGTV